LRRLQKKNRKITKKEKERRGLLDPPLKTKKGREEKSTGKPVPKKNRFEIDSQKRL